MGALMYEDTAPISQAARLRTFSNEYRSIVADKGAMVFHMLRTELGDDAFTALLREFYKKYDGKNANLNEFEKIALTKVPPPVKGQPPVNLVSFFSQWLNSTGVPEFKMEYIVYRTQKGLQGGRQDSSGPGYVPHAGGNAGGYGRKSRNKDDPGDRHHAAIRGGYVRPAEAEWNHRSIRIIIC